MTDDHFPTEPDLTRSALVAREFVHRLAPSQVLLTDVRPTGPDSFHAAAQWPRAHPTFDRGGNGRHDPLMVAETLRQLGIYLPLRYYGVAPDARLLIEEIRFTLDPGSEPRARYAGSEITCTARASRGTPGGTAAHGRLRNLGLTLTLAADGREFARAEGVARILSAAAYRAVRGGQRPSGRAGCHGAAAAPAISPAISAATSPGTAPLASRSANPAARAAPAGLTASAAATAQPSGLTASTTSPPLTSVSPERVGVTWPQDVLVAVDPRGAVRIAPADPYHPFFYDHPSDHITGMVLIGAVQQTAALQANEPRLRMTSCTLRALRFTEPGPPASVEIGPAGRFEIRQQDTVTAMGEARFGI